MLTLFKLCTRGFVFRSHVRLTCSLYWQNLKSDCQRVFFTNQGYVHCNKSETIDFFSSPVHVHVGVQFKVSTFLTHQETNAFTMHVQSMN